MFLTIDTRFLNKGVSDYLNDKYQHENTKTDCKDCKLLEDAMNNYC